MIKCITSDLDGTLLNEDHAISETTITGLAQYFNQGVQFIVATGREYSSVSEIFAGSGLDFEMILLNGSQARNSDGTLIENIILEEKQIRQIAQVFEEEGVIWNGYTQEGSCSLSMPDELMKNFVGAALQVGFVKEGEKAPEQDNFFEALKHYDCLDEMLAKEKDILKIEIHHKDVGKINAIKARLNQIENLAVASSFEINIEVTHAQAQKGITLMKLIKKLGIKEDEVMVIGDSLNDISMLSRFKYSYAMGNACKEAKAVANYLAPSNTENGVLRAVADCIEKTKYEK